MRGLRVGEGSDVRTCLVVSWKKIGWFIGEFDVSVNSWVLPDLGVLSLVFMCFNSAFIAFFSYVISFIPSTEAGGRHLSSVQVGHFLFKKRRSAQNFSPDAKNILI